MVELKEKTVEELRKMASRKKIEGRSKMKKAQLVRALQKCTTTKKRKMKGGALTEEQIDRLLRPDARIYFRSVNNRSSENVTEIRRNGGIITFRTAENPRTTYSYGLEQLEFEESNTGIILKQVQVRYNGNIRLRLARLNELPYRI